MQPPLPSKPLIFTFLVFATFRSLYYSHLLHPNVPRRVQIDRFFILSRSTTPLKTSSGRPLILCRNLLSASYISLFSPDKFYLTDTRSLDSSYIYLQTIYLLLKLPSCYRANKARYETTTIQSCASLKKAYFLSPAGHLIHLKFDLH